MKTCPNCNEVVGDSAEQCFNCKYSFKYGRIFLKDDKVTAQDIVNEINSPLSSDKIFYTLKKYIDESKFDEALLYIQDNFNCNQDIARETLDLYREQIYDKIKKSILDAVASLTPEQLAYNNAVARESLNKPTCPTCSSTNVQKIGTGERAVSVAMLGIFSKKINKSFKCKNCGYTW